MLIMCLLSALVIIAGVVISKKFKSNPDLEFSGQITVLIGVIAIIVLPIVWISLYSTDNAEIDVYYAIKDSIEVARSEDISEVERAALTTKIIETNEMLASKKYWNNTIFGDIIPDELAELDYLR